MKKPVQVSHSAPLALGGRKEILINYRPLAESEKWLKQRMADKSAKKVAFILGTVAMFFVLGGPFLALLFLSELCWALIGVGLPSTADAVAIAATNTPMLLGFIAGMFGLGGIACGIYISQPSHLAISADGIRLIYANSGRAFSGPLVPWSRLTRLSLEKAKGKTSPLENFVRLQEGGRTAFKLRIGAIPSAEERAKLLEAVERWAPELPRDAAVVQALELPPDHSFTEFWLQALAAPPKRERLQPLIEQSVLQGGRYRVLGQLGVGGQGTAYLAHDLQRDEEVVLKEFILPVYVDINVRRRALEKFENEARILQQMDHEQIVKLIDFFVEDHRGYLVLEHIDGRSLREYVRSNGPRPEEEVVELAFQMCTILEYLHGLEPPVVHRDFTPDNLILRRDGTLKLVDFNVAQQTESTATGSVVGKHAYLPPEQFRGQPEPRSDIYAMGATLFHLLTGLDPEPISVSHPAKHNSEVSGGMDMIVARATYLEAGTRHASAAELRQELKSMARDRTTSAQEQCPH